MLEVAAEPTRRRLLQLLVSGELTSPNSHRGFQLPARRYRSILGILAEVGLVTARKHRRERHYRLDERGVHQLRALFDSFWSDELDRLVADATKPEKETSP